MYPDVYELAIVNPPFLWFTINEKAAVSRQTDFVSHNITRQGINRTGAGHAQIRFCSQLAVEKPIIFIWTITGK